MFKKNALALMLSLVSIPVLASNSSVSPLITTDYPEYYFYIGAGLVGFQTDEDLSINNSSSIDEDRDTSLNVGVGWDINDYIAVESFYRYSATDYRIPQNSFLLDKLSLDFHQLGVSLIPSTGELGNTGIKLYGRLSAVAVKTEQHFEINGSDTRFDIDDNTGSFFDAGVGVQWNFGKQFMLRGEYITVFSDHSLGDLLDSGDFKGVEVSLGYRF